MGLPSFECYQLMMIMMMIQVVAASLSQRMWFLYFFTINATTIMNGHAILLQQQKRKKNWITFTVVHAYGGFCGIYFLLFDTWMMIIIICIGGGVVIAKYNFFLCAVLVTIELDCTDYIKIMMMIMMILEKMNSRLVTMRFFLIGFLLWLWQLIMMRFFGFGFGFVASIWERLCQIFFFNFFVKKTRVFFTSAWQRSNNMLIIYSCYMRFIFFLI